MSSFMTAIRNNQFRGEVGRGWVKTWEVSGRKYELVFEALLSVELFYVSLYEDGIQMMEPIPVKPAIIAGSEEKRSIHQIRGDIITLKKQMKGLL